MKKESLQVLCGSFVRLGYGRWGVRIAGDVTPAVNGVVEVEKRSGEIIRLRIGNLIRLEQASAVFEIDRTYVGSVVRAAPEKIDKRRRSRAAPEKLPSNVICMDAARARFAARRKRA